MKKVLLINSNTEKNPYPVPPLGICLLAGVLEREYDVRVYDGAFDQGNGIGAAIEGFAPDYIGVTIRNIDNMDTVTPANYITPILEHFIRPVRRASSAPLILGGSAFSIFPQYFMERYDADYGIFGESEDIFPRLLACLEQGGDPSGLPSVYTRDNAAMKPRSNDYDMNSMPFADIDRWIDYGPYRARSSYPLQTKRGCSHRCIYCTYNCIEGYRYRTRPPEQVAEEIERTARRLGPGTFEFVDSTFNDPPGHAESICREIIRRGLQVRLRTMGINPCNASAGLFALMKEAGFAQIDCTPDTASPSMLGSLGKNFTLDDLERAAGIISESDMPTMWFFIFGGPGENDTTIAETFEFIDRHISRRDMVHMTCGMRIYPGTGLYQRALDDGIIKTDDVLTETKFYISPALGRERLFERIKEASLSRPNCVPVNETAPPPAMMREAVKLREEQNLSEPMFRTLLRLRYRMMGKEMD